MVHTYGFVKIVVKMVAIKTGIGEIQNGIGVRITFDCSDYTATLPYFKHLRKIMPHKAVIFWHEKALSTTVL